MSTVGSNECMYIMLYMLIVHVATPKLHLTNIHDDSFQTAQ